MPTEGISPPEARRSPIAARTKGGDVIALFFLRYDPRIREVGGYYHVAIIKQILRRHQDRHGEEESTVDREVEYHGFEYLLPTEGLLRDGQYHERHPGNERENTGTNQHALIVLVHKLQTLLETVESSRTGERELEET